MAKEIRNRIKELCSFTISQLRSERILNLLRIGQETRGLNLFFATLCVIDLFGVFPIVTLPSALITCGLYGIPLLIFVITVQIYTAVVLGRCWVIAEKIDPSIVHKSRYPYAAVADLIYGKRMRYLVTFLLDLTVFGAGVPNILVASQNLELIGHRISNGAFYFSFCYWLIILGICMCPIMWLGSPKNMKTIASISVVMCSIVVIFIWICILLDEKPNAVNVSAIQLDTPTFATLLKVYGMIAFQFDIHPMLMTIEVDMEHKHKIGNAVCYGITATVVFCAVTTFLAAFKYGNTVTANVLDILPRSNLLYMTIFLVTLQLCLSNAVGHSALYQHVEDMLHVPRTFNIRRCMLRSFIVMLTVAIAELLPKFDVVMGIIGGTLTGPLIFIFPPLFYQKIVKMEKIFDDNEITKEYGTLMMDSEDGNTLSDDKVVVISTKYYGTFVKNKTILHKSRTCLGRCCEQSLEICRFFYNDHFLSMAVIAFGVIATIASTYFNLFNVTTLKDFWSPCIHNITYHFREL